MRSALFYIAGASTVGAFFTLWCAVAVQRVRKESEASKYGELCARIQKQIDETRMRISSVKMQLQSCFACILCRFGSICLMKESRIPFMTVML